LFFKLVQIYLTHELDGRVVKALKESLISLRIFF
jgi:hypothetical protein